MNSRASNPTVGTPSVIVPCPGAMVEEMTTSEGEQGPTALDFKAEFCGSVNLVLISV